MTNHILKCHPIFYKAVLSKEKTCEIRNNDRNFQVNDTITLKEFEPCKYCGGSGRIWDVGDMCECQCQEPHGKYTNKQCLLKITHILEGEKWGIINGYALLSIKLIEKKE